MIAILAATLLTAQYSSQISVGFARSTSIAPPLPINGHSKFAVSVYNGTKNSVIILSQDCKAGFESLSFELMDPKGKTYTIKRIAKKGMTKEAIPQTLESVGMLVHHLDFGDKTWSAPPKAIGGQTTGWRIRAKFTLPKSADASLWIGSITSGWMDATGTE